MAFTQPVFTLDQISGRLPRNSQRRRRPAMTSLPRPLCHDALPRAPFYCQVTGFPVFAPVRGLGADANERNAMSRLLEAFLKTFIKRGDPGWGTTYVFPRFCAGALRPRR